LIHKNTAVDAGSFAPLTARLCTHQDSNLEPTD
jgi:hypothetical protein